MIHASHSDAPRLLRISTKGLPIHKCYEITQRSTNSLREPTILAAKT